jgi:hypothetical protein
MAKNKDSFAYMESWWFWLLPMRLKEKVMARHYWKTAGRKTL